MQLYGLTGGIGSGKSTVASMLEEFGLTVVRADLIARDVVAIGEPGLERIVKEFGRQVLDETGSLDRRYLAKVIFADSEQRRQLEAIVHPLIQRRSSEEFRRLESVGTPVAVYECPLLFETGRNREVDAVIFVNAPRDQRVARISLRDGLSADEIEQRIAGQMDEQEKRRLSDYVLENDGSLDVLRDRVSALTKLLGPERQLGIAHHRLITSDPSTS